MYLFTYGSLQRSQYNNYILLSAGGIFVKTAKIQADKVTTNYPFPAVKEGLGLVFGEVYEIPEAGLLTLDRFEGNPTFYQRRSTITTEGLPVEVYWGTGVIGIPPRPNPS